ncbi:hypothetical protein DICPUDRAFT_78792 [Dictyostelium purpureum]|uniref:DUF2470 domain-containing protein n=1 Tax=Dictyostelium purpureum TaxID=5786 RepID=F0ZKK5_DICPU|nr:uncharacterized protein DICPUDRAFT_78792 [Dictyostelium purpureum]EGC35518.1 hypothetical protein DICPUDRAFT_78792 [Dictyostelium purpureum]|eukprot:XP_003287944.1 hypothetical protein DICPUDRAFT_78792 [Dictyostelium purpureum]
MIRNLLKTSSRLQILSPKNLKFVKYNSSNNNIIYNLKERKQFYSTQTNNNNNGKDNNIDIKNNDNNKKEGVEKPFYGSIGDIDFSKKQYGPSSSSALTREQISKSLLLMRRSATLSSVYMMAKMTDENQTPIYGSLVPYALHDSVEMVKTDITDESKEEKFTIYNPIIALHKDSPHITHFKHFNKLVKLHPEFDLERINISGRAIKVESNSSTSGEPSKYNIDRVRRIYYDRNPKSKSVIEKNRDNYLFYIVELSDIYHYNRNSKLTNIPLNVFKSTRSDPITIQSGEIIETVNSQYEDALISIVEQYGDVKIDSAFMYFLDSFGLNCIGKKKGIDEWLDIRIPFDTSFDTLENCKNGLFGTLKESRNHFKNI